MNNIFKNAFVIFILAIPIYLIAYHTFSEVHLFAIIFTVLYFAIMITKFCRSGQDKPNSFRKLFILILISSTLSLNANQSPYIMAYTYRYFFMQMLDIDAELIDTQINTKFVNLDGTEFGRFIESTYTFNQTPEKTLEELNSKLTKENRWYGAQDSKYCPYVDRFSRGGGLGSNTVEIEDGFLIIKLYFQPFVYDPIFKKSCPIK